MPIVGYDFDLSSPVPLGSDMLIPGIRVLDDSSRWAAAGGARRRAESRKRLERCKPNFNGGRSEQLKDSHQLVGGGFNRSPHLEERVWWNRRGPDELECR